MPAEEILINTILAGERQFVAGAQAEGAAIEEVGVAAETTGRRFERAGKRGFLMNQALFTMRRLVYANTLALVAGAALVTKWGFDYNSAMQQATVALQPVAAELGGVHNLLTRLFNFTKYTPFQFKDVTIAFRQMYLGMRTVGISSDTVLQTLHALTDALSATGRTSPGALNRVAVALQHMAYMGHLTGQVVLQLARDGLPIYAALKTELGLTADQIHHIGQLGIPAGAALHALNKYIESTPGFANAAYRQATHTLHGLFTTFRDDLSQIAGTVEKGFFERSQRGIQRTVKLFDQLSNTIQQTHGNLEAMIRVLDKALTPGSHGVLRFWDQLRAIVHDFWQIFSALVYELFHSKAIWLTLYLALVALHGVLGFLVPQAHALGYWIGVLLPLYISWKIYIKALLFWQGAQVFVLTALGAKTKTLTFWQFALAVVTGRYTLMAKIATAATWLYVSAQAALTAWTYRGVGALAAETAAVNLLAYRIGLLRFAMLGLAALGTVALVISVLVVFKKIGLTDWLAKELDKIPGSHALGKTNLFKAGGAIDKYTGMNWLNRLLGNKPQGMAGGGTTTAPWLGWVGERGPELLALPGGASVANRHQLEPIFNMRESWMNNAGGPNRPIIVQVVLDRKVIAEAVARQTADAGARA